MKILQLSKYYPPTYGGVEVVAEFFTRALMEAGHEVIIQSYGKSNQTYTGNHGEKVYQSKETIKLGSSPISINYFLNFKRLIKQELPDLIFVHLPNPFSHEILSWFSQRFGRHKVKIVGIYHSDIVNQVHLKDVYNLHFLRSLKFYDSFICSSENLKKSSEILSKIPKHKTQVIPFCIEHGFLPVEKIGEQKPKGKFLTIGRMVPYKGFEFLIDCFNSLPYELTVIGNGPLKDQLKKKASSNIRFVGEINEETKFKMLSDHDALIVSSLNRSEAYGMTIVEAFSLGVPVIASDIDTGVSFLVQEGKTGYRFPIKNKEVLRDKLELIMQDPKKTQQMSSECLSFYHSQLSFKPFSQSVKKFVEEIVRSDHA